MIELLLQQIIKVLLMLFPLGAFSVNLSKYVYSSQPHQTDIGMLLLANLPLLIIVGLLVCGFIYNCCIPSKTLFNDRAKNPFQLLLEWIASFPWGYLPYHISRLLNKRK